jgi:hypothetical protein
VIGPAGEHPDFQGWERLVGTWSIEARHPLQHRTFAVSLTPDGWRYWNDDPSFAQRFTGAFSPDGSTISGRTERSEDDGTTWELDMEITYRRVGRS